MFIGDNLKKNIDEFTHSRISDAYILGQNWSEIASQFPGIDQNIYEEIAAAIETRLTITAEKLRPSTYYRGVGLEADEHQNGMIVNEVYKACPAMQLGVEVGDIVTKVKVNQIWVDLNNTDLRSALKTLRQSDSLDGIQLEVIRAGERMILGEGLQIRSKVIDAKSKYMMNFTAKTLGRNLLRMQITTESSSNVLQNKNLPTKQGQKSFQLS